MSDLNKPTPPEGSGNINIGLEGQGSANLVYILYLMGLVFGLIAVIGVILAYMNTGKYGDALDTHFRFQIRTFWMGFLFLVSGIILSFIFIGWLVLVFWIVWLIIRVIKGMQALGRQEAIANPTTWGFSPN